MDKVIEKMEPRISASLPKKWYVLDTETNGLYGKCWLVCLMGQDGEHICEFRGADSAEQFRVWMDINIKKFYKTKIYMFNAEFDFVKIWGEPYKYAMEGDSPHNVVWSNGFLKFIRREYISTDKKGKHRYSTIQFIDIARNTYKSSLSDIGDHLGVKKGITPQKFIDGTVKDINDTDVKYCWLDCNITRLYILWLNDFYQQFNVGMRLTTSANAKAVWQTSFIDEPIYINHHVDELFRGAYYGGRTEVFNNGLIPHVYYYDINSMYPANMVKDMPDPNTFRTGGSIANYPNMKTMETALRKALIDKEGYASCKMEAPKGLHIPLLPMKRDKLIFPKIAEGKYCFPEIRKALEIGYKFIEINHFFTAERMKSPFIQYVDFFSKMKEESEKRSLEYYTSKIMLNGLYGKMGERVEKSKYPRYIYIPRQGLEISLDDGTPMRKRSNHGMPWTLTDNGRRRLKANEKYNDRLINIISDLFPKSSQWNIRMGGYLSRKTTGDIRAEQTCVAFAAYVTSYARVMLYEYLEIYQNDVVYCDTDSIVMTCKLPDGMVHPTETGKMELVGEFTDWQSFAPKWYGYTDGDKFVCRIKGVIQRVSKLFKGLDEITPNAVGKWIVQYDTPFKTHESIIRGVDPYTEKSVEKVMVPGIGMKRKFQEDGTSNPK